MNAKPEELPEVIRAAGLARRYVMGVETIHALRGVSLQVDAGEYVAIMRPSGSGKSTLMNLLGCLDTPDDGDYWLRGQLVSRMNSRQPQGRRIGGQVAQQLRHPAADLVGRTLLVKAMPFEIVGVYALKGAVGFANPDDDIYIPIETSRYRVTGEDRVQTIAVEVERGTELAQAMVTVERVLRRVHRLPPGRDNDFAIVDRKQFLAAQQETTQILGLRMALGATRTHILAQFLIEALILCLVGGAIGILVGAGAAWALSNAAGWRTAVTTDALVLAFAFSAAVGLVFGLWPARRAALLDPIEALRHE